MGVSLKPGGADPAVQALAVRASAGDKQAQYELGRWFEDSTDADGLKKAIKLYQIAATPRGGSRMMYTPGPSGVTASVVSTGPPIVPSRAAQVRLAKYHIPVVDERYQKQMSEFGMVLSKNERNISVATLQFYPNRETECPFPAHRSLTYMLKKDIGGSILALPLPCFFPKRIDELVKIASRGNIGSQFTLSVLVLDVENFNNDNAWHNIRELSDSGYGPASIALGIHLEKLGDRRGAVQMYVLANSQGISNAELYIRRAIQLIPRKLDK